jgi:hypothetical protein
MNKLDGVPGAQNRSGVSGLLVSDPDDLRGQAESCRQLAVRALKPEHGASWMRLADEWDLLARAAEKPPPVARRGHNPAMKCPSIPVQAISRYPRAECQGIQTPRSSLLQTE